MKLKINLKSSRMPVSYNMLFVSMIKENLKVSDIELYNKYYGSNLKVLKDFTYTVKVDDYDIQDKHFINSSNITLTISTINPRLLISLYNGFVKKRVYRYKEYELSISSSTLINEKEITSELAVFKSLSPFIIKNKDSKYLTPEDGDFEKEFNYTCNLISKELRGSSLKKPLLFKNIDLKQKKVTLDIRQCDRHYFVKALQGSFVLHGDIDDLNFLQSVGIGLRRSEGFGCITAIGA